MIFYLNDADLAQGLFAIRESPSFSTIYQLSTAPIHFVL